MLSVDQLQDVLAWIDRIPLSRPKKNIARDFSDGVMAAEVVKHYFPKMVDLHNYVNASSRQLKISNWDVLNRKVFSKLKFHVPESTLKKIVVNTPGVILPVLHCLQKKIRELQLKMQDIQDASDTHLTEAEVIHQLVEQRANNGNGHTKSLPQRATDTISDKKPAVKQEFAEKEPTVKELLKTVEFLQMSVTCLEDLVQMRDKTIENLYRQLQV